MMNFIPFSYFVILILMVGAFLAKRTAHKVLEVVSIGLLYLRMHITFTNHVKNAKE